MAEGLNMTVQEVVDKLQAEWSELEAQYQSAFEIVGRAVDKWKSDRTHWQVNDALGRIDNLRSRQAIITSFVEQLKRESGVQVLDGKEAA
jgi:hypothetical protein